MNSQHPSNREKAVIETSSFILSHHLWIQILAGMALGVLTGLALSPSGFGLVAPETGLVIGDWLALPGVLFLGLIQMVIIPLVICSVILGITDSGNLGFVKAMGLRIVPYFIITTAIAIAIGIILVQTIQPGALFDPDLADATLGSGAAIGSIPEQTFSNLTVPQRIANLLPTNLAQAELEKNMLQIIIAAIITGIALLSMPQKNAKPLTDLCLTGQILTMKIVGWAMAIAPYAVFGLISNITIRAGIDALYSVGLYMVTVLAGLGCVMMVYLFIVRFIAGYPVGKFMKAIREAQLLAFSTSSSGATMPFSIHAAEENLKARPSIARFVIPLGATINMDGTALYQAVAALFLCQVFSIDLSATQTLMLLCTTIGASIGTPATPGVGIVVLATILTGIGVPPEGIALIIGVDRILDMCRTTVNVTGDLTATAVMERWVPRK